MYRRRGYLSAMGMLRLTDPVQFLKGVGPARAELLAGLGVRTVGDLLHYFPRDLAHLPGRSPIGQCNGKADQVITLAGSLKRCRLHGRWARAIFSAILTDESGQIDLTWFNAGWMKGKFNDGDRVVVSGKLRPGRYGPQLTNPKIAGEEAPAAGRLASGQWDPVYPANEKIASRTIQQIIQRSLPQMLRLVDDPFPPQYLRKRNLLDRWVAVGRMHFPAMAAQRNASLPVSAVATPIQPADAQSAIVLESNLPGEQIDTRHAEARRRLAWDEGFVFQLALGLRRRQRQTQLRAVPLACTDEIRRRILRRFPFELTAAQVRVIDQIAADMAQPAPMNRLLQGDVGSGKTVVALFAGLLAVAHGHQAAIMAPTEILAHQHFERISQYLAGSRVRFAVLTGSNSAADRKRIHGQLARGELDLVVGTSALLSEGVRFARLALAVIDEQHKFGVKQRAGMQNFGFRAALISDFGLKGRRSIDSTDELKNINLRKSAKSADSAVQSEIRNPKSEMLFSPHTLVMTATPIPRSLALTVFGDLAVSTIDQLPPGRGQTQTRVVAPTNRDKALDFVEARLAAGGQAFFVCPRVGSADPAEEELENLDEPGEDLATAEQAYRDLQPRFEKFGIALVHGQMDRARQSAVIGDFAAGRVHVLVATTVVEVGVDIARANVMAVLSAERFGLAQLHQLRGRIGRSSDLAKSYCLLFVTSEEASGRLKILEQTTDGQKIAEEDLSRRGPGQFFGLAQHGLPEFRYIDLASDLALLRQVRQDAFELIAADPALAQSGHHLLKTQLAESFGKSLALIDAG